jgi:hypothetical protein
MGFSSLNKASDHKWAFSGTGIKAVVIVLDAEQNVSFMGGFFELRTFRLVGDISRRGCFVPSFASRTFSLVGDDMFRADNGLFGGRCFVPSVVFCYLSKYTFFFKLSQPIFSGAFYFY